MKIIVCGAGPVGYNIARYLAGAGNDVTVIDQRQELAQKIGESLDIQAITGFASHPEVLEQAGARDAELLIAVTNADEVNMVTCQIAHSLFNIPTINQIKHMSMGVRIHCCLTLVGQSSYFFAGSGSKEGKGGGVS